MRLRAWCIAPRICPVERKKPEDSESNYTKDVSDFCNLWGYPGDRSGAANPFEGFAATGLAGNGWASRALPHATAKRLGKEAHLSARRMPAVSAGEVCVTFPHGNSAGSANRDDDDR